MGVDQGVVDSPAGVTVVLVVDHHARQPSDRGVRGNPFDYFYIHILLEAGLELRNFLIIGRVGETNLGFGAQWFWRGSRRVTRRSSTASCWVSLVLGEGRRRPQL